MKKIRYFPFGYYMIDGKIVIRSEEGTLLRELFSGYLNGASLQQLADYAEQTGIRFRGKRRALEQKYDCKDAG